jgi:hypothetical protein
MARRAQSPFVLTSRMRSFALPVVWARAMKPRYSSFSTTSLLVIAVFLGVMFYYNDSIADALSE